MKDLKLKIISYDVYWKDDDHYDREDILHTEYYDEQGAWDYVCSEILERGDSMPPYDERDKILPKNKWLFDKEQHGISSDISSHTYEQVMAMSEKEYNDKFSEYVGWWNSEIPKFRVVRNTNLIPYDTVLENLVNTDAKGWLPS
tara:strand:+ start:428 stop:859 length:432 start_codon:yes stop_codon:yes gene_type:complete